jgi:ABC-type transport system substrate-binding protein
LNDWGTPTAAYVRAAAVGTTGNGPYIIREWTEGERIVLERNPGYYRANEGLPIFGYLIFRFVGENANANIAAILSGECDIVVDGSGGLADQEYLIRELQNAGQVVIIGSIEGRDFVVARPDICGVERDWGQASLLRRLDEWGYGRICID